MRGSRLGDTTFHRPRKESKEAFCHVKILARL